MYTEPGEEKNEREMQLVLKLEISSDLGGYVSLFHFYVS